MGILLLISMTACLALLDIAAKSVIEGYLTRKEERTACQGKIILRKVYNRGFCMNLLEKKPEVVKFGICGGAPDHLPAFYPDAEEAPCQEDRPVADDCRGMEQYI